jgi:hypothetical protein
MTIISLFLYGNKEGKKLKASWFSKHAVNRIKIRKGDA